MWKWLAAHKLVAALAVVGLGVVARKRRARPTMTPATTGGAYRSPLELAPDAHSLPEAFGEVTADTGGLDKPNRGETFGGNSRAETPAQQRADSDTATYSYTPRSSSTRMSAVAGLGGSQQQLTAPPPPPPTTPIPRLHPQLPHEPPHDVPAALRRSSNG